MKNRTQLCFLLLLGWLFEVEAAGGQGYYNVLGPRVIRPNSEYHCAISVQSTSEPTKITATLTGLSYNGTQLNSGDSVVVQPYTSRMCRLEVGELEAGDYKLEVKGSGGLDFIADFPLEYVEKSYSVFIQTDRAVYKPGSTILFRAIVLNSELKPAAEVRNELLHIHISDGKGDRVKEWRRVEATKGVFTEELKLGNAPVLGDWHIGVTVHGQTFNKSVKVAEYISPKFVVSIDTLKHVTFRDNKIIANIKSQYNYGGKKVVGEATVTVYPTIYSGVIQPIFQNPVRKVVPIDGSVTVDFEIDGDLRLNDEYERTVMLDVTIEEFPTGRRQNNSVEIHLHKYDYKMELIKTADYFKPGLLYTAYVKISNHDGTPVQTNGDKIVVRHGYSRTDEIYIENQHKLDKNGVIKLEYVTPSDVTNTTALRIEAEFRDLKERISPIPAAVSFSNTFLQIALETDRPIVNLDVEVYVNCTEPMKYINYVLMGRGDVLIANTFQVYNSKEYRFHFTATHAMVPISHLIVSYVRPDGELVGDSLDIEIDGLVQNFIDIQVNTVESEPSRDIELTVRARPNSYIGLLAVDEEVGKLRSGYDLTHTDVSDELQRYDRAPRSPYAPIMKDSKYHFFWKPGASNPHSAIYESGADLLTNAHIYRHQPTLEDIYLRPVFYGSSTVKPDRGFGLQLHSVTRPPLAGPYAFSRIPKPVWNKPKVYLTEEIQDPWLFTNFSSGYEGKTSIRRRLPGTLNNWVITGFSLDPLHGLGLVTSPKMIRVTKSFVVSLDLPHSMKKGEILAVPVVVYNHIGEDINAEVTLHNPDQKFEFAEVSNDVNATRKIELYRRKRVSVKRNSGASVSFMITPLVMGSIEIKVTANSPRSQDVSIKNLMVVAGGEKEYYTESVVIDLRTKPSFKGNVTLKIPKNVVENSIKIEAMAIGDILGSAMVNLDNLIHLPSGCGEQNLVNFMPNLIIMRYLRSLRLPNPAIQNQAIKLLETAYQQQLAFKRDDGSFSAFGTRDSESSVWITAYTALALTQAKSFIYIDEKIVKNALTWLSDVQGKNGSFVESGPIIHEPIQNNAGNSLALTAFTIIAFIENQKNSPTYTNIINKGLDYIARHIDENESTYSIALCSYALQLTKHASRQSAFNLLDARSKTASNKKWWRVENESYPEKNPWTYLPRSIDIETTAYALLTFIEANLLEDAVPVLDWLIDQQNELGGFTSSQDTVVGLFALYKVVSKISSRPNMQIEFSHRPSETSRFSINQNNAMILQKMQVSQEARVVNVSATGTGFGLFRIAYQYNMNVTGPWPMFTLDPQVDKNSNKDHLQLSICTAFVSENLTSSGASNMAVMEVTLPSGFTADIDSLPSLEVSQNVQKVETKNDLTKVILYFNNVTRREYCPTVSAFRTHKVAKLKPVSVVIYDYYDSSRRARVFYHSLKATLCDICEDEDCGDICTKRESLTGDKDVKEGSILDKSSGAADASSVINSLALILFIVFISLQINT